MIRRILIGGTWSGCGKTTVTCAVLSAFKQMGYTPSAFKCGPDYIDPMFHREITGIRACSLDSYFCDPEMIRSLLAEYGRGSDIAVIEGVMGYYDGASYGASGDMLARITDTPAILAVDCRGMNESAGAVISGFLDYVTENNICGVIFNRLSPSRAEGMEELCRRLGTEYLGFLPVAGFELGSRSLGLITAAEVEGLRERLKELGSLAMEHLRMERILELAEGAGRLEVAEAPGRLYPAEGSGSEEMQADAVRCRTGAEEVQVDAGRRESGAEGVQADAVRHGCGEEQAHADAVRRKSGAGEVQADLARRESGAEGVQADAVRRGSGAEEAQADAVRRGSGAEGVQADAGRCRTGAEETHADVGRHRTGVEETQIDEGRRRAGAKEAQAGVIRYGSAGDGAWTGRQAYEEVLKPGIPGMGMNRAAEAGDSHKLTLDLDIRKAQYVCDGAECGPEGAGSILVKNPGSRYLQKKKEEGPVIAVARDRVFCFIYQENLDLLKKLGCRIEFFSPLSDAQLPEGTCGLVLCGGYPELYAEQLAGNAPMLRSIYKAVTDGLPCIAECGGFIYLHRHIVLGNGRRPELAGVIDGEVYNAGRLRRFGYAEITASCDGMLCKKGGRIRVHEFHYWDSTACGEDFTAVKRDGRSWSCGYNTKSLYAGFPHLYFYAEPEMAVRFAECCRRFGQG